MQAMRVADMEDRHHVGHATNLESSEESRGVTTFCSKNAIKNHSQKPYANQELCLKKTLVL